MSSLRVLSASADANLNNARAALLKQYGFYVTACNSTEDAQEQLRSSTFDVLIFGSTLPREACWDLAATFRKTSEAGRIVEILPTAHAVPKNQPDSIVVRDEETRQLVATIRQTMRAAAKTRFEQQLMDLTSRAYAEQDPKKLMKLVDEINRLFESRGKTQES